MSYSREATGLNLAAIAPLRETYRFRTAPNLLTLTRILLTPLLVLAVLDRIFVAAFLMFLVAALTDAMDGLLARWLRQRTRLGQYLDPIADKILLSSLFLVLTRMGILETRVAAIVFGRDIGMLCVAGILYSITDLRDFRPTLLGKANSLSQMVAIGFVLLSLTALSPAAAPWIFTARRYSLDVTMLLTVLSGFHYALVASQRIGLLTETTGPQQTRRQPLF
uniref:CDP-alcohol phosphatidyltransferase n=1 Tax=mine drainage metagenome TaxID=410659 RepID=E6QKY0_9ZZZZ